MTTSGDSSLNVQVPGLLSVVVASYNLMTARLLFSNHPFLQTKSSKLFGLVKVPRPLAQMALHSPLLKLTRIRLKEILLISLPNFKIWANSLGEATQRSSP